MEYKHFAGQSRSVDALFAGIASGRIVHAVIIEGSEESGKEMLAEAYAQALLCNAGKPSPCKACKACRLFEGGNHPDYIAISAGKNASVGVEDVALLTGQAYILPNEGGRKVFIIKDAQLMTPPAQNKLLKLLEEPPLYIVIILLCSNISSILPTVLSRCIRIRMPRLASGAISEILVSRGYDVKTAQLAAASCGGMLGTAVRTADGGVPEGNSPYDVFFGISDKGGRINACEYLVNNRQNARHILNIWQNILRDCLAITQGGCDIINYSGEKDRMELYSKEFGVRGIINKLDVLCKAEERLLSNCQYAVLVDWLLSMI